MTKTCWTPATSARTSKSISGISTTASASSPMPYVLSAAAASSLSMARQPGALRWVTCSSSLLSPSLMLAQELRSGKLGGLCGTGSQLAALKTGSGLNAGADAAFDALSPPVHCALCGSSPAAVSPFSKLPAVVGDRQSANPGEAVWVAPQVHRGLRCIRGPPSF